jgi:aldose 1-epimerase
VRDAQGRVTATLKGRAQQIELTQGPNFRAMIVYSPNPLGTGRGSQGPGLRPGQVPGLSPGQVPGLSPGQVPGLRPGQAPVPPNPLATPNFICIEPMAGITNALNLAHRGVYKELQSIPPGGAWQESFWIRPSGF